MYIVRKVTMRLILDFKIIALIQRILKEEVYWWGQYDLEPVFSVESSWSNPERISYVYFHCSQVLRH